MPRPRSASVGGEQGRINRPWIHGGVQEDLALARGAVHEELSPIALGWEQGVGTCLQSGAQLLGAGRSLMAASWSSLPWSSPATRA